jgi:hypothetical protein
MKKQLLLAGLSLVLSTATFAQKKNVTDAILLMRKYNPMGEIAANKKNGYRSQKLHRPRCSQCRNR